MTDAAKRNVRLLEGEFKQADFSRNAYRIIAQNGVTLDDIIKPDYWAHVARLFNREGGDIVEVLAADKSFYAELLILSASNTDAKAVVLREVSLKTLRRGDVNKEEFEVYWGGAGKWCVRRNVDKAKINEEGFATKEDAEAFLESYIKKMKS